jgi:hypothetical protein
MTDSSDHIRIAVSPISVAVREVMAQSNSRHFRHGRVYPGHPRLLIVGCKDVDARDKPGHDDLLRRRRIASAFAR